MVSGPVPAVSAGETTLASDGPVESAPNQKPSSAVLRLCAQIPVSPDWAHTVPPASSESVAELAGASSVLSRIASGTATELLQPLLVVAVTVKSPASAVVTVSSSETVNRTVVAPYAASPPTGTVGCAMWMPGVVELSVTPTSASAAGPGLDTMTEIRADSPASSTSSVSHRATDCSVGAPGATRPLTSKLSTMPEKFVELRAGEIAQLPKPRCA